MCAGVVPQQPPRYVAPAARSFGPYVPNSSASIGKQVLPSFRNGMPAFGWTLIGARQFAASVSTTGISSFGPSEQFTPMMSAPRPSRMTAADCGSVPVTVRPSSLYESWQTTGRFVASFAASSAARISWMSMHVSMMRRSAPASASAFACSRNASYASSKSRSPSGSMKRPVGPIEPATRASLPDSAMAAFAMRTAAALNSATRSSNP